MSEFSYRLNYGATAPTPYGATSPKPYGATAPKPYGSIPPELLNTSAVRSYRLMTSYIVTSRKPPHQLDALLPHRSHPPSL